MLFSEVSVLGFVTFLQIFAMATPSGSPSFLSGLRILSCLDVYEPRSMLIFLVFGESCVFLNQLTLVCKLLKAA